MWRLNDRDMIWRKKNCRLSLILLSHSDNGCTPKCTKSTYKLANCLISFHVLNFHYFLVRVALAVLLCRLLFQFYRLDMSMGLFFHFFSSSHNVSLCLGLVRISLMLWHCWCACICICIEITSTLVIQSLSFFRQVGMFQHFNAFFSLYFIRSGTITACCSLRRTIEVFFPSLSFSQCSHSYVIFNEKSLCTMNFFRAQKPSMNQNVIIAMQYSMIKWSNRKKWKWNNAMP